MLKPRVYIDTSVVGGCLDDEFLEASLQLFDEFKRGLKTLIVSDILLFELEKAPDEVKSILETVPAPNIEYAFLTEEANELADTYIKESAVAESCISDARHIAIAAVERVDLLVSWNFKHIVNINRIHLFNGVNLKLGYPRLEIRSPREVLDEG